MRDAKGEGRLPASAESCVLVYPPFPPMNPLPLTPLLLWTDSLPCRSTCLTDDEALIVARHGRLQRLVLTDCVLLTDFGIIMLAAGLSALRAFIFPLVDTCNFGQRVRVQTRMFLFQFFFFCKGGRSSLLAPTPPLHTHQALATFALNVLKGNKLCLHTDGEEKAFEKVDRSHVPHECPKGSYRPSRPICTPPRLTPPNLHSRAVPRAPRASWPCIITRASPPVPSGVGVYVSFLKWMGGRPPGPSHDDALAGSRAGV